MKPRHTPGPWQHCTSLISAGTKPIASIVVKTPEFGWNAKRIVECVNACEGIADPSILNPLLAHFAVMADSDDTDEASTMIRDIFRLVGLKGKKLSDFYESLAHAKGRS
jgi:hypothetical protein